MSGILQDDLDEIIQDECIEWGKMEDSTILVTGATGLVGSLIIKALIHFKSITSKNLKIIALIRDENKAKRVLGQENIKDGLSFVLADVNEPIIIDSQIDYIIHGASVTQSKKMVTCPVETFFTSVEGTRNILELARQKHIKSMVYISSMEVYGITDSQKKFISEDDLGFIDNLSVRSSYSEGKRCCELICASYHSEYKVPVKIARLAQTFGAGVHETEERIFAQFAKSVINDKNIVLHTSGESVGNYCYLADAVRGLLCILTKGKSCEAYTLVNEETTMKIRDMAAMVANQLAYGNIKVVFDIPEDSTQYGYMPDVTMHLSGEKARSLGWTPRYNIEDMYRRMMEDWKQSCENEMRAETWK